MSTTGRQSVLSLRRLHQSSSIRPLYATIKEKEFLISNLLKSEKALVESAIVGMVLDSPLSMPLPLIIMLFLEALFMELRVLQLLGWS
ncbi:hypothetical protein QN277_024023 [Acacia crassicarpa]|uniref:Uncharacterized protein n=1 Tax=Acacia crassicarpa TaxID=499986 RepID=A0AAE1JDV4_9FABA|nr:hypothetical protein QN277_024023 [Acacia crassicarpa]